MARPPRRAAGRRPTVLAAFALGAAGALALAHAAALPARPPTARPAASAPADPAGPRPQAPASRAAPAPSTPPALARPSPASAPSTASAPGAVDPYDGDVPDAVVQRILDAASPADLPAPTAAALVALARADLAADLRGARTAGGAVPHVQAAVARRHQGRADVVDVTLIYQSRDPADTVQQYRAVLTYARCGAAWIPAAPSQPGN